MGDKRSQGTEDYNARYLAKMDLSDFIGRYLQEANKLELFKVNIAEEVYVLLGDHCFSRNLYAYMRASVSALFMFATDKDLPGRVIRLCVQAVLHIFCRNPCKCFSKEARMIIK
jgi:hypothetical protein